MIPIIKPNKQRLCYKNWVMEDPRRGTFPVIPLKFIEFFYKKYFRNPAKRVYFTSNSVGYIGEIWECYDVNTGNIITCKFRREYVKIDKDHSLHENKTPIVDYFQPNLLIDRMEEYNANMNNKFRYPNLSLQKQNIKFKKRLENLKRLYENETEPYVKKMLYKIIRHKESPTLATFREMKSLQNSELYQNIVHQINNNE